ncbi:MAG TPA: MBL fold metallo-hydrolase [Ignavibacteria bacterium]|nr:MBL fold metallo-hydrolase [Ignavibacteria bacterium]
MKIQQFTLNPFSMNCYIYYDETSKDAVLIDPGAFSQSEKDMLLNFIKDNELNILFIINTHGHMDHILGNKFAKDAFNVPVYMHKDDEFLIENVNEQARFFGLDFPAPPPVDVFITEETDLKIGNSSLKFIHTPGHSPGSVCIIDDKNKTVFCGDVVFKNSIGRTDLQGGDLKILLDSIKNKLFKICKDDYKLYPGHMEITTVGSERKTNPFIKPNR